MKDSFIDIYFFYMQLAFLTHSHTCHFNIHDIIKWWYQLGSPVSALCRLCKNWVLVYISRVRTIGLPCLRCAATSPEWLMTVPSLLIFWASLRGKQGDGSSMLESCLQIFFSQSTVICDIIKTSSVYVGRWHATSYISQEIFCSSEKSDQRFSRKVEVVL